MIEAFYSAGLGLAGATWWTAVVWPVIWALIKIVVVLVPLMICVAYLTLWERKAIGFTQIRFGPNRVGPSGLLTPIADALKLLTKEIIALAVSITNGCEYCINSHSAAVLRLGLDREALGEIVAVTDLFNGMNRVADAYQVEPDIRPPA